MYHASTVHLINSHRFAEHPDGIRKGVLLGDVTV